jgi:hypothetical protein
MLPLRADENNQYVRSAGPQLVGQMPRRYPRGDAGQTEYLEQALTSPKYTLARDDVLDLPAKGIFLR